MRAQLVLGRDLIVRAAAFQAAFLVAAGVAARMGTAQIAAHQIGMQLWEFTALLLDSFAIAAQSLVGAALGASRRARGPAARGAGVALELRCRHRIRRRVRRGVVGDPAAVHLVTGGAAPGPRAVAVVRGDAAGGRDRVRRSTAC